MKVLVLRWAAAETCLDSEKLAEALGGNFNVWCYRAAQALQEALERRLPDMRFQDDLMLVFRAKWHAHNKTHERLVSLASQRDM